MSNDTSLILRAFQKLVDRFDSLSDRFGSIEETIEFMKEQMVVKDDLKGFATKEDLKQFATKKDLESFMKKDDFYRAHDTLIARIDQVAKDHKQHLLSAHT